MNDNNFQDFASLLHHGTLNGYDQVLNISTLATLRRQYLGYRFLQIFSDAWQIMRVMETGKPDHCCQHIVQLALCCHIKSRAALATSQAGKPGAQQKGNVTNT